MKILNTKQQLHVSCFLGLICLNLFSALVNAQGKYKADCIAGPAYDVVDTDEKYYHIKENILLIFKFDNDEILIQKFDTKMLTLLSINKVEGLPSNAGFEGFHEVAGKLLFFYGVGNKKADTYDLYSREVDFTTGNLSGEPQNYAATNQWKSMAGFYRKINRRSFGKSITDYCNLKLSSDGTKILIYYTKFIMRPSEKIEDLVFSICVYDCTNGMNKLWSREVETGLNAAASNLIDFTISNDGKVFLAGYIFPTAKEIKAMGNQYDDKKSEILVWQVGPEKSELNYAKVDFYNMRTNDFSIETLNDGRVWLSGTFRYIDAIFKNIDDVHGYFQVRIAKGGVMESIETKPVPAELSSIYYYKEDMDTGRLPGFDSSPINQAIQYANGERFLVGEEVMTITSENIHYGKNLSRTTGTVTTTSVEYPYYAINVAFFSSDGKIAYIKHLPKRQRSGNARFSISYKYFESNNYSYFFYLDNLKNLEVKPYKPEDVYLDQRPGFMAMYKLDRKTGDFTMIPLLDISNVAGLKLRRVSPNSIVQSDNNEYIMEANDGKKDILVKFTISD